MKKSKLMPNKQNSKSSSAVQLENVGQENSLIHYREFGSDVKGGVKFSRQGEKKHFFENGASLNEKRFEYLELPAIYSKVL